MLQNDNQFQYTKLSNQWEMAVSFPTEMSWPMVFALDVPTVISVGGQAKFEAQPKISTNGKLRKPNEIKVQATLKAIASSKVQSKISFITPYNHEQYTSGYDKNMQVYLPMKINVIYNFEKKELSTKTEALEQRKTVPLVEYSSYPYTAAHDILNLHPETTKQNTHIIDKDTKTFIDKIFGKSTGMAFRVQYQGNQRFFDLKWLIEQIKSQNLVSMLYAPVVDETMQRSKFVLSYDAEHSQSEGIIMRLGHMSSYNNQPIAGQSGIVKIEQFNNLSGKNTKERQEIMAQMAQAGISNVRTYAADASIEFMGSKAEYAATFAHSRSRVDPKSRTLFFLRKTNEQVGKPYQFALSVMRTIPNVQTLSFEKAQSLDSKVILQAQIGFGQRFTQQNQVQMNAQWSKSQERQQYVNSLRQAKQCREQMAQGNYLQPACANLTEYANLLDRVNVQLQYDNIEPEVRNLTQKIFRLVRHLGFYNYEENNVDPQGTTSPKEVKIEANFHLDLQAVNVTMRTEKSVGMFKNVRLHKWIQPFVVVHPYYSVKTCLESQLMEFGTLKRKLSYTISTRI